MIKNNDILKKNRLILASASPRRSQILKDYGLKFEVYPANIDETALTHENVEAYVTRLARSKASTIAENYNTKDKTIVLAADTVVTIDKQILGKPSSEVEAYQILKKLSGRSHHVLSAYCIIQSPNTIIEENCISSSVVFKELCDTEIWDYIKTKEPMDKAGAYAIQGQGKKLIQSYEGSLLNIIGLPFEEIHLFKSYL